MAIFDAMFEFDDGLDLTSQTAAETEASTNVLDWGASDLEMGAGEPLWLNVRVDAAFASSAAATLTVALMRETDSDVQNGTEIWLTPALALSSLTAGAWIMRMPLPYNVDEDAFLGLLYTTGSYAMSAGTVDAWIDHGPQSSYDTQVGVSNI